MGGYYYSNASAFKKAFAGDVAKGVKAASIYLSGRVKADVSQPGTLRYHPVSKKTGNAMKSQKTVYSFTHSRPGNPPFKQTGGLRKSIAWEVASKGLVGRVGSNIRNPKYPLYLELGTKRMKHRSYLRAGLTKHKLTLVRILTRKVPAGGLPPMKSNQSRSGHFGRGASAAGWN